MIKQCLTTTNSQLSTAKENFLLAKWLFSCKKLPNGCRSLYFQSSDRTLHHWFLPLPQDLIIVCFPNMLIPMVLYLHSRVKGENVQIFWVTLCLILDNLINKTTPVWNLKNVELSRRKYYGTLDKREKLEYLEYLKEFHLILKTHAVGSNEKTDSSA